MISITECREILGDKADSLDDATISRLLAELYLIGEIVVDRAVKELSNEKKSGNIL